MIKSLMSFIVQLLMLATALLDAKTPTSIGYATYLGGDGDHDEVMGVHIAEDGTIVIARNVGTLIPPGITPVDLPGFQAPTEAIPRVADFEDQDEYLREGIAWINVIYRGLQLHRVKMTRHQAGYRRPD